MITRYLQRLLPRVVLVLVITSALAVTISRPSVALAHQVDGHPARIHEGTCDEIGLVS
jgi:hypothetical protein